MLLLWNEWWQKNVIAQILINKNCKEPCCGLSELSGFCYWPFCVAGIPPTKPLSLQPKNACPTECSLDSLHGLIPASKKFTVTWNGSMFCSQWIFARSWLARRKLCSNCLELHSSMVVLENRLYFVSCRQLHYFIHTFTWAMSKDYRKCKLLSLTTRGERT